MFKQTSLSLVIAGLLSGVATAQVVTLPQRGHHDKRGPTAPLPLIFPYKPQPTLTPPTPVPTSPVVQSTSSPQPASLTVTPTTLPEILQVLDNTGTWVQMGKIDSAKHTFSAIGGGDPGLVVVQSVGMAPGGQDNSPFLADLMSQLGSNGNNGGNEVLFPPAPGLAITPYYFSKSFDISRVARFRCGSGGPQSGVELVFAAGVHGVIQDMAPFTPDGQYGGGTVDGCIISSMGQGGGTIAPNSPTIHNATMGSDPSGLIPPTVWHTGDGVVASAANGYETTAQGAIPAVPPGSFISNVSTDPTSHVVTLTLGGTFVGNPNLNAGENGLILYQLPATLKYTIQTTVGSSTAIVTAGPRPLRSGEMIWSDAFPLGSTVFNLDGITFPQTVQMGTYSLAGNNQLATVTHSSGSPGQMWIMPDALMRLTQSRSNNNQFIQFPIGLGMACTAGTGLGSSNCTASYDDGNFYLYDLIGRWEAGDNTSASSSINEEFARNYWVDLLAGGTLGVVYLNLNSNSYEGGSSFNSVMGNCANDNWSVLFGGYIVGATPGCANDVAMFPAVSGGPFFSIGNQTGDFVPGGTPGMLKSIFGGPWIFAKNGYNGEPSVCLNSGQYILGISYNTCATAGTMGVYFDSSTNTWGWSLEGPYGMFGQFGYNYMGYLPPDKSGGITASAALLLGNSGENWVGQERNLDAGHSPPNTVGRLQGDHRLNQAPISGGYSEWTNVSLGSTSLTAAVTAGDTTIHVAACPNVPVNTWVIAQANVNVQPIVLDQALGRMASCASGVLTLTGGSAYDSINGIALYFTEWHPAGLVARETTGIVYSVGLPQYFSGFPACDGSMIGSGIVYDGETYASKGYGAVVAGGGSLPRPMFCDGVSWTYH